MKKTFVFLFLIIPLFSYSQGISFEKNYYAHFVDTDVNIYRDLNDRMIMHYTISSVETEREADIIKDKYFRYGIFESIQLLPTADIGVWVMNVTTKPGVKIKDQRKLFVTCGIYTIFVDDQPYPAESFKVKMLNTDQN